MRRRDFLTLLGAAVAWPRPAIGQSPSKVYRVGLLSAGAPIVDNSSQGAALIRGFTQRGYKLGRNLAFERIPDRHAEILSIGVDCAPPDYPRLRSIRPHEFKLRHLAPIR